MEQIKIIITADGSQSLLHEALNETYHSVHGAVNESLHVFIKHGVTDFIVANNPDRISILEVGFGTGLNALLTLHEAIERKIPVAYTSLELYPLQKEIWSQLAYPDPHESFSILHEVAWNKPIKINNYFTLCKVNESLLNTKLTLDQFDIVYYDAFAPTKQPEMWELPVLRKVADTMKLPGMFVTYCAKGQLKRDLRLLGLQVQSLPGPPGKREMVRATKT